MKNIYVGYEEIHQSTSQLFAEMRNELPDQAVVAALARGGWLVARIFAAALEEHNIESHTYSISPTYKKHRTPDEFVEMEQGLDNRSIQTIEKLVQQGAPIVAIDSVCQTGREMSATKNYLNDLFPNATVLTAAAILVKYESVPHAPWRNDAITPDFYGSLITEKEMPYIDFPWEYSSPPQAQTSFAQEARQ